MTKNTPLQSRNTSVGADRFLTYLVLLMVPMILPMILIVYYQSSGLPIYPHLMSFPEVFFNGVSACTFYYYTTHTKLRKVASGGFGILFSFSYAFSSYLLVQEYDLRLLSLYALLPLLYLCYEWFLAGTASLPYVLLLAVCLALEPVTASILALYFGIVFFFETGRASLGEVIADFLHLLSLTFFAFLLPGFLTLPKLYEHFAANSASAYDGFQTTYPLLTFLSRFLLGSVSYRAFDSLPGVSLYAGLFLLFGVFLYFCNPGEKRSGKLRSLVCLLLLLCSIELSPLRYLLELTMPAGLTICHSFFVLFWLMRLSIRGWGQLGALSRKGLVLSLLSAFLFLTLVLCGTAHSFHPVSIMGNYLFLALYGALLLCAFRKKPALSIHALQKIGILFGLAELALNAFLCSNASLVPSTADASVQFVWRHADAADTQDTAQTEPLPYQAEYALFWSDCYAKDFVALMNRLSLTYELTDADRASINPYALPEPAEELNYLCQKIGAADALLTPIEDLEITFADSDLYRIDSYGHSLYNLCGTHQSRDLDAFYLRADVTIPENRTVLLWETATGNCFRLSPETAGESMTCYLRLPNYDTAAITIQVAGFYLNEELLEALPALLNAYCLAEAASDALDMTPYYLGIFFTLSGVLLLLCFTLNKDKQQVISALTACKHRIKRLSCWENLSGHCWENAVYYGAFLLPLALYISVLLYFNCEPFGVNSLLDQDGISSILPDYLDFSANLRNGNYRFSMNTGYGSSIFPFNILHLPLALLNAGQISTAMVLAVGFMMAFASLFTVWYLTHRLSGKRADKRDWRLLAPAALYALNSFMLAMHGYVDWFFVYMVFPLLILALDQLIYRKKWLLYTLLLGFCMYSNIQLALYCCIALFCLFFTYRFDDLKDFFQKGIRFGLCSLLSACNAFVTIGGNLLYVAGGTAYAEEDSVAPVFGFFGSFLEQWKNLMIFSPVSAVSSSNLHVNFYIGVLALPLMAAYFLGSRCGRKQKIQRFLLLALLLFSFNEQLTAYVINGMHYQSKVPNRHVFLFTFLCAVIAYDGILALTELSRQKRLAVLVLTGGFFIICQLCSTGNSTPAFYATLGILALCATFLLLCRRLQAAPALLSGLACILLTAELTANLFYTASGYALETLTMLGDYPAKTAYYKDTLGLSDSRYRMITPAVMTLGSGSYTDTPGITAFTPYLKDSQKRLAALYGYSAGVNTIYTNQDGTPMANALSSVKYIAVKQMSNLFSLPDLPQYRYLGRCNDVYIYENPWALPLGFYVPESLPLPVEDATDMLTFCNKLAALYCAPGTKPLLDIHAFSKDWENGKSVCRVLDQDGRELSAEEAVLAINEALDNDEVSFPIQRLSMDLTVYPSEDGYVYLYCNEFIPLGLGTAGEALHRTLYYPSPSAPGNELWITFRQDTFEEFYENAMENVLEDIVVRDNRITGTTNYEKAGYTMLSLPYDQNWKAYIDGKEAPVTSPYNAFLLVETPAGSHHLELVYTVPASTWWCIGISAGSLTITLLCYLVPLALSRFRKKHA